jgi:stage II sporulation protein D
LVSCLWVLLGPALGSAQVDSSTQTLRVGLATDLAAVSIPWNSQQLLAEASGGVVAKLSSMKIEPSVEIVTPAVFRLQVAALKDEGQAHGLAAQLRQSLGESADVVFDAGSDLYRVRIGSYRTREEAETAQGRVSLQGLSQTWVVSEKGQLGRAELVVSQGDRRIVVPSRWLSLRSSENGNGVQTAEGRFRDRILIFLNDRGLLNLINELPLEEYLRGVVPKEMGPEIYDRLEALKAQTVAARTYTLKNLGEFADEGYDICATPRCQVYGGMGDEHPLSDRAIRETAGEVLVFKDQLVEALYSSTCGGHTENVNLIFPLKNQPYLQGVACLEAGMDEVSGQLDKETPFTQGLLQEVLPSPSGEFNAETVGERFKSLAVMAGLPIPEDHLGSLERREVQRFIASIYDLALDVRLFVSMKDLEYLLDQPPLDWTDRELRLAAYLIQSGLLSAELEEPLERWEVEETLFRLALYLAVLESLEGRYLSSSEHRISIRSTEGMTQAYPLANGYGTYRRRGDELTAADLALLPGDSVNLFLRSERVLAVTHEANGQRVAHDRTNRFKSWTRFRSDRELRRLVQERYPGLGFQSFEILERGVSGRAGKIRILGDGGKSVEVQGLAVRWTLDVPDTLFTAKRVTPPGKAPGWLFTGRGWGHGVGMCQIGAFGMAQRGHTYRAILQHYYTGVEIVHAPRIQGAARPAAP